MRSAGRNRNVSLRLSLEHDPEKGVPVFGKDHAPAGLIDCARNNGQIPDDAVREWLLRHPNRQARGGYDIAGNAQPTNSAHATIPPTRAAAAHPTAGRRLVPRSLPPDR